MGARAALAVSCLLLSACAAAIPVGTASRDPDPVVIGDGRAPTAEIIVYRAGESGLLTNVITSPALLLDQRAVGTCRFGQPLRLRVPAGNYTVSALTQGGEANQWVVIEDGKTLHLRCGVSATRTVSPTPRLDRVDPATAAREAGL